MTDENGQAKGFGFVHYETREAADNAVKNINSMSLGEKKVVVGRFIPQNQDADSQPQKFRNVFVNNFGDELDENKLQELFSKYGKVIACKVKSIQTKFILTFLH